MTEATIPNGQNAINITPQKPTKFCKACGKKIDAEAVFCPLCGCQIEELRGTNTQQSPQYQQYQQPQQQYQQYQQYQPPIIINNTNTNMNGMYGGHLKNKWVAFFLCLFLGFIGAHKFYEGKAGMGILYFFTCGLFFIGAFIDLIVLLVKPNPYYV